MLSVMMNNVKHNNLMYRTLQIKQVIKYSTTRYASSSSPISNNNNNKIRNKIYTMGEGWTGALGTGSFDTIQLSNTVPSSSTHNENTNEKEEYESVVLDSHYRSSNGLIQVNNDDDAVVVKDVSCGWGHTVVLLEQDNKTIGYMTGRPFDFRTTLRLKRLPTFVRDFLISYIIPLFQSTEYNDSFSSFQIIPDFTPENKKDNGSDGVQIVGSAGLTAIRSKNKEIYLFGRNEFAQCGLGYDSITIWPNTTTTQPLSHISIPKVKLTVHDEDDAPAKHGCFVDIALGLQHCIALDEDGKVYSWGKNARGQCGNVTDDVNEEDEQKDSKRTTTSTNETIGYHKSPTIVPDLPFIHKIASGFHMSIALSHDTNEVFIWGKNVVLPDHDGKGKAIDANFPIPIQGLPSDKRIADIACTSHSISILYEDGSIWGYGVTTDNATLTPQPICMLPPGIITFPVKDFHASFDRTFVTSNQGKQLLELQLWSDGYEQQEQNQVDDYDLDMFTPSWFYDLTERGERVKFVRRGWLHTVIVTEVDDT